jgi:hypothetical protein
MLLLTAWQATCPIQAAWSGNPGWQSQYPDCAAAPPCNNALQFTPQHKFTMSDDSTNLHEFYLVSWTSSRMKFSIHCNSWGKYLLTSDCTQATSLGPGTYHFSCMSYGFPGLPQSCQHNKLMHMTEVGTAFTPWWAGSPWWACWRIQEHSGTLQESLMLG